MNIRADTTQGALGRGLDPRLFTPAEVEGVVRLFEGTWQADRSWLSGVGASAIVSEVAPASASPAEAMPPVTLVGGEDDVEDEDVEQQNDFA